MNDLLPALGGIKIITSPLATERVGPRKVHYHKLGMKMSYHNRIQKKWIKRFGWENKPCMYKTPMGIVCHPALIDDLKSAINYNK